MRNVELYDAWAPTHSPWSLWAKPVLFATMRTLPAYQTASVPNVNITWASPHDPSTALIVDLPGAGAVTVGLALAARGYRPIPLFNGCDAPGAIVDVMPIITLLVAGAEKLKTLSLPPNAPPVFLLDADRRANEHVISPGRFDNRWCVVPQDMPSASKLALEGVRHVRLRATHVRNDLAHILRRYQEGGLQLSIVMHEQAVPEPLQVPRPSMFHSVWHRFFVTLGLRRNAAGGFGAVIPEESTSSGFG